MGAYLYMTVFTHGGVNKSLLNKEFEPEAGKLLPKQMRDDCLVESSAREENSIGSFLNLCSILSMTDKLGEYLQGEVDVIKMAEAVRARLQEQFQLARYIYIMGF